MSANLDLILRAAHPQVVATLSRVLGDVERAMDATQEAMLRAVQKWPQQGTPEQPVAWLVTVGRNHAIDQLRRDQRSVALPADDPAGDRLHHAGADLLDARDVHEADDEDMLKLLLTCVRPQLGSGAQLALMLKVVVGLSVEEIAQALLATPLSIEKRITRAKRAIADDGYETALEDGDLSVGCDAILKSIYLMFNTGYGRIEESRVEDSALVANALRLARITGRMLRRDSRPRSLLALMLLSAARMPARLDAEGAYVPLHEQDRSRWNKALIQEGTALLHAVFALRHPPYGYQIQAAISALHCRADHAQDTDWVQIVGLYDALEKHDPSPVVAVNRAVAQAFAGATDEALAALEAAAAEKSLAEYQPLYAALGFVQARRGDLAAARLHYERAAALTHNEAHHRYLSRQLSVLP
ncbi:MAG: sigma-70 family RNA polymerase sigma factor [Pseudomonadota bacterium]